MKKILSLLLALTLSTAVTACGTAKTEPKTGTEVSDNGNATNSNSGEGQAEVTNSDMPWAIEPLSEKVTLKVGNMASTSPHLPTYIAMRKGWLDEVNIEVESVLFNNGPAMMEAATAGAWECGSTGIGGVITGILGHDIKVLSAASKDEGGHQAFFARKDSPIVAAGKGNGDYPEVYGDAESWKGKEIFCPKGTTNHFVLKKMLEGFGLTLDDVNVVNMEVSSGNTAFKAGQGDVVGVWGPLIYSEDKAEHVMVASDAWVKTGIVTNYVATPKAWNEKQEAIEKWLEVSIMTGEWIQDHLEEAAQYMVEMYEEDGYPSQLEENYKILANNPFTSLNDLYTEVTEKAESGDMLISESQVYDAMKVFVSMGNYTEEQLGKLLQGGNFMSEPVKKIYDAHK